MSDTLFELESLTFAYHRSRPVLRGIDLRLSQGERVGVAGANGSGKSTLLQLMVGLLRPKAGRIIAFGKERHGEGSYGEVRRRAGLVFQNPDDQLFCPTVLEDVAFGPLNLGLGRQKARQRSLNVLKNLGLMELADRATYDLSGGEKRLVSLACVLAMRPEVLLLDEPTAGLDEQAEKRLRHVLSRLPQAMLVVAHDPSLPAYLKARRLVLREGRLEALKSSQS